MGLINKRNNSRNLFDFEQIPAFLCNAANFVAAFVS